MDRRLLVRELSVDDQLWVHILRANIGQGRGDYRQMFGAAALAAGLTGSTSDPAGACVAAHYAALAHLTDVEHAKDRLDVALDLARQTGDVRLITLIGAFLAVADLAAGRDDDVRGRHEARPGGIGQAYDRFILDWAGWMLGLPSSDGAVARRWMGLQQEFLDRTGIVETWLTSFSTAMCDVIDGGDVGPSCRAPSPSPTERVQADADCVLVIAYAEICAGRFEAAAELLGTAMHDRFNATALYVLYRAVLDRLFRDQLDAETMTAAMHRGRTAGRRLSDSASRGPLDLARWPIGAERRSNRLA